MEAESQLDYTYAKHLLLIRKQKLLRSQIETLEQLPVGAEAFDDDLKKWITNLGTKTTTAMTTTSSSSILKSEHESCNSIHVYDIKKGVKEEEEEEEGDGLYGEIDGSSKSLPL